MSGRIREEYVERITKAKSVKHAEYEILKILLYDGWRPIDHIHLDRLYCKLVPELDKGHRDAAKTVKFGYRDKHAAKRFDTACNNIAVVMRTMLSKRVKHLPDNHQDAVSEEEWWELDRMRHNAVQERHR
tara:strand:+ start:2439 stop:2828 length:390 start_codon:yes stop_codon:yes gene_type:complete